jgi:hypothetical protein
MSVHCSTSCWTIWGGGHRFVVGCQYTVCCSTSCWTIWGGGHRCVEGCQDTVCCGTSSWTIWGGGHRCVVGCQYTVCCSTSCWSIWGAVPLLRLCPRGWRRRLSRKTVPRTICRTNIRRRTKVANRNAKFGTARQKMVLEQIPNPNVVRVAPGTGNRRVGGNRRASRNGSVSDPHNPLRYDSRLFHRCNTPP